jgi:hypothetical protein
MKTKTKRLFIASALMAVALPIMAAESSSALTWGQVGRFIESSGSSSGSSSRRTSGNRKVSNMDRNMMRSACQRVATGNSGALVNVEDGTRDIRCVFENEDVIKVSKNATCKQYNRNAYYQRFGPDSPKNGCYAY